MAKFRIPAALRKVTAESLSTDLDRAGQEIKALGETRENLVTAKEAETLRWKAYLGEVPPADRTKSTFLAAAERHRIKVANLAQKIAAFDREITAGQADLMIARADLDDTIETLTRISGDLAKSADLAVYAGVRRGLDRAAIKAVLAPEATEAKGSAE